jgi:hypothetical protein
MRLRALKHSAAKCDVLDLFDHIGLDNESAVCASCPPLNRASAISHKTLRWEQRSNIMGTEEKGYAAGA